MRGLGLWPSPWPSSRAIKRVLSPFLTHVVTVVLSASQVFTFIGNF